MYLTVWIPETYSRVPVYILSGVRRQECITVYDIPTVVYTSITVRDTPSYNPEIAYTFRLKSPNLKHVKGLPVDIISMTPYQNKDPSILIFLCGFFS